MELDVGYPRRNQHKEKVHFIIYRYAKILSCCISTNVFCNLFKLSYQQNILAGLGQSQQWRSPCDVTVVVYSHHYYSYSPPVLNMNLTCVETNVTSLQNSTCFGASSVTSDPPSCWTTRNIFVNVLATIIIVFNILLIYIILGSKTLRNQVHFDINHCISIL